MSRVRSVHRVVSSSVATIFFFKQKTAYEMRISDWSSDVCSSDLGSWIDEDEFARALSNKMRRQTADNDKAGQGNDLAHADRGLKIGRASCRERVCQYV